MIYGYARYPTEEMQILISPIRSVMGELDDRSVYYILCTSSERLHIEPRENVLILRFMDITDETQYDAFQMGHAKAVSQFLQSMDKTKDLFICCDGGQSRSAAIAAAIMLAQNQSDLTIWQNPEYHPNHHVFKLQCLALGINISDDEVSMRRKVNEDSFHKAVQDSRQR